MGTPSFTRTLCLRCAVAAAMLQALAVSPTHSTPIGEPDLESAARLELGLELSRELSRELSSESYEEPVRTHVEDALRHARQGNPLLVAWALEKARDLAPDDRRISLSLGRLYNQLGRHEKAIEVANQVLAVAPDAVKPHRILGTAYLGLGQSGRAIEEYEKFVEKAPTLAMGHQQLGRALLRQGEKQKALEQFDAALERNPRLVDALVQSAALLEETGRHEEAIERAQRALQANPKAAPAELTLGDARLALGDAAQAEEHYGNAVRLQPNSLAPLDRLAGLYVAAGRKQEAIAVLKRMIARSPRDPEARQQLALLYADTDQPALREYHLGELALVEGKPEEAVRHYQKAIEHDSGMPAAHLAWAGLELREGDTERAEELARKMLEANPENASARVFLGQLRRAEGKVEQAEAEFRKAADRRYLPAYVALADLLRASERCAEAVELYREVIARGLHLVASYRALGDCLSALDRPEQAERAYQQILARSPRDPQALHGLAALYLGTEGDPEAALVLAQEAVAVRPGDAQMLMTLGRAYHRAGRYTLAGKTLEAALELRPDDPAILYHLGRARHELGDGEGAQGSVERALEIDPAFEEAAQARRLLAEIEGRDSSP